MKDEFEYKYEILIKEVDNLQSGVRNYDTLLFRIKGWAITVFLGAMFFAAKENEPTYAFLGAISIIFFWIFDAINKSFQRGFIIRANKIEHFLRSKEFSKSIRDRSFHGFNIPDLGGRYSVKNASRKISPLKGMFYIHTMLIYLGMIIVLIGVGVLLAV
jgi:hypothetical protein